MLFNKKGIVILLPMQYEYHKFTIAYTNKLSSFLPTDFAQWLLFSILTKSKT